MNGFKSKQNSIRNIVDKLQPKVIVFNETKLASGTTVKKLLPEYEICSRNIKSGKCGIAVGVKLQTFKSVLDVTSTNLQDILTVRIGMESCNVRVIVGYAPQETEKAEVRENFFTELEIEIAKCSQEDELPLIIGDLNAKIEMNDHKINALTPNGKLLMDIINNHSLDVLNFSPKCTGKWTHVIRTTGASSVLDYALANSDITNFTKELVIDEECVFCPFSIKKNKKREPQYSDHNAFIIKMVIEHSKKADKPQTSWKITPEGLQEFHDHTNNNCLRDLDETATTQKMYNMLENNIYASMNKCFQRRKQKKTLPLRKDFYKTYKTITSFARKGKAQRKVAKIYTQEIHKMNAEATSTIRNEHVKNTIRKLTVDNSFSPDLFWKLCKKSRKQTMMSTSVETEDGSELYGDELIQNAYRDEFIHRLRRREIIPELKNFETRSEQICELKLMETKLLKEPDYTVEEVAFVMSKLKYGKSGGRDNIPPDIYKSSGNQLTYQIVQVINKIKNSGMVAAQWKDVQVSTIYKNKGKKKQLVNQRGIFLKQVLSKIFGKVNMIRIKDKLNNIDPFQAGGRNDRSPADQTYLLRSAIDHSKYMNQCMYLTLYDFSQCFDSLWLQDCLLSLWDVGVRSEILNLIATLNETCNIVVKTPVGLTSEFQAKHIVQQGSVTGGALCTVSTGEITKENLGNGVQIGQSNIKALTFVDDIAGSNTEVPSTYRSHEKVVWFSLKKRVSLNGPKCMIMPINKKISDVVPQLKIQDKNLQEVQKSVYLGDVFNRLGNNWDLIESRINKGQGCMINSMSLCSDVTLGTYSIQTLLLLYRSVFVQVVLHNAQSWSNIIEKQMDALRTIQLKYIKRAFHSPPSTCNTLTFLETGILPVEKMIQIKQLKFLHHILTQEDHDPVKITYHEQTKFEFEKNWGNEVQTLRKKYEINFTDNEIVSMSKEQWKNLVVKKITHYTLNELVKKLDKVKHTEHLAPYTELEPQPYMQKLIPIYSRITFQIRTRVIDLKEIRKYEYEDNLCRLCGEPGENIQHVVNQCTMVTKTGQINPFSNDLHEIEETAKRCYEFSNKVKKLKAGK